MCSVNFSDLLLDKLLSFSSKMKETSFKPGSALCLMSDSHSMYKYDGELLDDLLLNGILASEYESLKPMQGTKIGSPFMKNIGTNNLEHSKLGFSPHLFNVVQDSIRFIINQPEVKLFPPNGILSHVLCDSVLNYPFTMKDNLNLKLESDVGPANETKLKMSVSVKSSTLNVSTEVKDDKQNCVNGFTLNLELANRKTKEMNKRSKKRRRRQKKNRNTAKSTPTPKDVIDSFLGSPASSHVQEKSRDESKFIVSVEHNIQVSPSLVSSFVISVGSVSDEDSDWDFCSETDEPEPTDFEFTGLFLANLSTPAPCLHPTQSPVAECNITAVFQDDEIVRMQAVLMDVNKNWNESTKEIDKKAKSPSKVSFASDDKLTEIFLVEVYDRKGEWETKACERLRFRRRIEEMEKLISPCLSASHRLAVYEKLVQSNL